MAGFEFKDLEVVLASEAWLGKLLRVKIGKGEVRAGFRGSALQDLFEFLGCIERVPGLLECQREVVARIDRIRLESQGHLVSAERLFPAAKVIRGKAKIVVGIEVRRVGFNGLLVVAKRLVKLHRLLRGDAAGEVTLGFATIAGFRQSGRGVAITRVARCGRRRLSCGNVGY